MGFDEFRDQMDLQGDIGNVASALHNVERNRLLEEQNQLLQAQENERRRLASLPNCPACKKPLELDATICAYCRQKMVWCNTTDVYHVCLEESAESWIQNEVYPERLRKLESELNCVKNLIPNAVACYAESLTEVKKFSSIFTELGFNSDSLKSEYDLAQKWYKRFWKRVSSNVRSQFQHWHEHDWLPPTHFLVDRKFLFGNSLLGVVLVLLTGLIFCLGCYKWHEGFSQMRNDEGQIAIGVIFGGIGFLGLVGSGLYVLNEWTNATGVLKIRKATAKKIDDAGLTLDDTIRILNLSFWSRICDQKRKIEKVFNRFVTAQRNLAILREVATTQGIALPLYRTMEDLELVRVKNVNKFSNNSCEEWPQTIEHNASVLKSLATRLNIGISEPPASEASNKTARDYWIMRGEELHGPFKAVNLVEAAKYKQLKKRDLLGNSPSGPWEKLTKEHLQSMHQGNDVEIK